MKVLNFLDVVSQKAARIKSIPTIENSITGHCVHTGKISYACKGCFQTLDSGGIQIGTKCMCECPMCYYDPTRKDSDKGGWGDPDTTNREFGSFSSRIYDENFKPYAYSYQSAGETLIYIDEILRFSEIFKKIKEVRGVECYHHLYTNGILATKDVLAKLREANVHELRFHITASLYSSVSSDVVLQNMYEAKKAGFIVTVEEPSWPAHKEFIFKHLPIFEDIGVQHLNLIEVQVTEHNKHNITSTYKNNDNVGLYRDYFWHLYDGGLVYDVMEEVAAKNYKFSVLDCNSAIERCRQIRMGYVHDEESWYDGVFSDFPVNK